MFESTKNIVSNIRNEDYAEAKKNVENELLFRAGEAIEILRPEVMRKTFSASNSETEVDSSGE